MTWTIRLGHSLGLAALCLAFGAVGLAAQSPAQGGSPEVRQQSATLTVNGAAEQLGIRLTEPRDDAFALGTSIGGPLVDPSKLEKLGLAGLPVGARVTAMRTAPTRVRLEVDVMEPAPLTRRATLVIDEQGRLSPAR